MRNRRPLLLLTGLLALVPGLALADEVIKPTETQVIERVHPRTGQTFHSVVANQQATSDILSNVERKNYSRPDYRLLDHTLKKGTVPYDGPYNSRKKVYVFAGTVATLGVVGGSVGMLSAAAAPVAAGIASTGGAVGFLGAGMAVGAGTLSSAYLKSRPEPQDQYEHTAQAKLVFQKASLKEDKPENTSQTPESTVS